MANDSLLDNIVSTIETVTSLPVVYYGGNRSNPIEYTYSYQGDNSFRLEVFLHGEDVKELLSASKSITSSLVDFGDLNSLGSCSISHVGGGQFTKDNTITIVMYFSVIDYDWRFTS